MGNVLVLQRQQKCIGIKFIASEWKKQEYLEVIGNKILFVTDGQKVFNIREGTVIDIPELESNHEEADTRMLLHTQHASQQYQKIVISTALIQMFLSFACRFNQSSVQTFIFSLG